MKTAIEFPQLDFTALLNPSYKYAVHCSTQEQALHFIREVRRQYPDHAWTHEDTRWDARFKIAYSPYINTKDKRMTWDTVDHYESGGFVVLDFEDLVSDESEIAEVDQTIEFLFGG